MSGLTCAKHPLCVDRSGSRRSNRGIRDGKRPRGVRGEATEFLAENSAISDNRAKCFLATAICSSAFERHALCGCHTTVTLKIETIPGEGRTTIKLIGRIRAQHLAELRGQIETSAPSIVLELREVTLVDADVVRFLSACESEGIQLQHCSAYIREWIVRERESAIKG
jgi:hypothetical protein